MYILTKKYGRLCNRLFSVAHILALAIEHKHTFANVAFYDYARYFRVTERDIFCRYPARKCCAGNYTSMAIVLYYLMYAFSLCVFYLHKLGFGMTWLGVGTVRFYGDGDDELVMDENPFLLAKGMTAAHVICFQGWNMRAYQSLQKHGDKVRDYFAPTALYQSRVKKYVQQNRAGCDVLVGVVIRHGDYRTWKDGRYFYSIETYAALMKQVETVFSGKKTKFLICSDEEQDTQIFTSAKIEFCFRSGHMIENLYSLAECDYIVSPPSTYGMWASFYGKTPLYTINDPCQIITAAGFSMCEG